MPRVLHAPLEWMTNDGSSLSIHRTARSHLHPSSQPNININNVFGEIKTRLRCVYFTVSRSNQQIGVYTQQSSLGISGSRRSPAWIFSPVQALKLTALSEGCREAPSAHTGVLRQWIVMCCTASVLKRWMKFIWIRPTSISIWNLKKSSFFLWLIG